MICFLLSIRCFIRHVQEFMIHHLTTKENILLYMRDKILLMLQ